VKSAGLGGSLLRYVKVLRGGPLAAPGDASLGAVLGCPVFVINLERSPHRRAFMERYLASLGITLRILPAVDGSKLDLEQLARDGVYVDAVAHEKFSRSLSPSEIGATLSHLSACRTIVDENLPVAVVLEDDVTFIDGVAEVVRSALQAAPPDWDVLQLYYWCKDTYAIAPSVVGFNNKACLPVGCLGYVMRQSGARKMLESSYPICYPADSLMGRSPRVGVTLYGVSPSVITLEGNLIFPTELRTKRTGAARVRLWLKQAIVRVSTALFLRGQR
jgi:glycosyl transferase, family 25